MYNCTKMIRGHWPTPLAKGYLDLDTADPRRGSSGLDRERQPTRSHTIAKIQKKQSTQKHLDESKERPAKAASTTSTNHRHLALIFIFSCLTMPTLFLLCRTSWTSSISLCGPASGPMPAHLTMVHLHFESFAKIL